MRKRAPRKRVAKEPSFWVVETNYFAGVPDDGWSPTTAVSLFESVGHDEASAMQTRLKRLPVRLAEYRRYVNAKEKKR